MPASSASARCAVAVCSCSCKASSQPSLVLKHNGTRWSSSKGASRLLRVPPAWRQAWEAKVQPEEALHSSTQVVMFDDRLVQVYARTQYGLSIGHSGSAANIAACRMAEADRKIAARLNNAGSNTCWDEWSQRPRT